MYVGTSARLEYVRFATMDGSFSTEGWYWVLEVCDPKEGMSIYYTKAE